MLTIRLLGPLTVLHDGRLVTLKRRKSRALLAYLAAQERPIPRRRLTLLLWPDHNDQTARHNLRTTLHSLRQAVGEAVRAEDEHLALAPEVEVDLHRLAALLAGDDAPNLTGLRTALDQVDGELLADFDTPDTEEFDDWLLVAREQARRLVLRGYQRLAAGLEATGDLRAALDALQRALTIDPFQEDLQRAGLRLQYLTGDRAGAIRRYEEFARLLEQEMGVAPMAETRALLEEISAGTLAPLAAAPPSAKLPAPATPLPPATRPAPPPAPHDATLPFAGRRAELAQLHAWHAQHRLILVEGEAGLGKTRLVETYTQQVVVQAARPALVLLGQGRELESRLPYQPLIEALRGLLAMPAWAELQGRLHVPAVWWDEVARLAPELTGAAGARPPDESRLWEGVFQFLAALTQHVDLMLVIDDLHWVDAATLGLLAYVTRQAAAAALPLTLVATSRTVAPRSEAGGFLQALLREDRLARLALSPLAPEDVLALARHLSPGYAYPLSNWLQRTSEGNPFVMAELLRHARRQGLIQHDGAVNLNLLPSAPVVPPTVYALIQTRLAALSEAARRVLDAAVAVGREFEFEVAARAAALSDAAALDALDELCRARLIHEVDGRRFAFDHTLTMEVAYQEVGEARHRLLHRRVAAALESIHADDLDEVAGLLAHHYAEGDQSGPAAKFARRAGARAVRLAAWKAAVRFFRQALAGYPADEHAGLLTDLGNALLHAGDLPQATETLHSALRQPAIRGDDATLRRAIGILGEALLLQGRYGEVVELVQAYVDHPRRELRVAAEFMWGAALAMDGLALEEAVRHLTQAELLLRHDAADPAQAAQVQFELGNIDAQQGRLDEAIARYQTALRLTETAPGDAALRVHVLAHNNLAYHYLLQGDSRALDYAQRGLALAQEKGMLALLPYLHSTMGEIHLAQSAWNEAESAFRQGLAHAQRLVQPERIAGLTANLGLVALGQGQTQVAVHRLSTALAQADAVPNRFLATQIRLWLIPLLPADVAAGHLAQARAAIEAGDYTRLRPTLAKLETGEREQR